MSSTRLAAAALSVALLAHVAASATARADEADFYKGKTVKMIVGFGPGGRL